MAHSRVSPPRLGDPTMRLFTNPRMWSKVKTSTGFGAAPLARAICPEGEPPPLRVLDGTAGLGGTAIRLSETFGLSCEVTAVEASAPLACLLDYGLRRLAVQDRAWAAAAGRVRVEHADAAAHLANSFGENSKLPRPCVVYLNPCMDLARPSNSRLADLFAQAFVYSCSRGLSMSMDCRLVGLADSIRNEEGTAARGNWLRIPASRVPREVPRVRAQLLYW